MSKLGQRTTSDYIPWGTAMERTSSIHKEKPVLAGILATGFTTGLRISDILAIKSKDFAPKMLLCEKKTGKPRSLVLNPWLIDFIDNVCGLQRRPGQYLFSKSGSTRPLSVQHVTREMKKVFADLSLNISTHSMRKTFGRRVMQQHNYSAEGLVLLMEAFNHSSPAITKVYLGLRQEEVNQIYLNIV